MVLGKNYRLSMRRITVTSPGGHRGEEVSFLLEQRVKGGKESSLLFQSGSITGMSVEEVESMKQTSVFKMCNEAYAVLGILSLNSHFTSTSSFNSLTSFHPSTNLDTSSPPIHYLVIVTGIVSVGKILEQEIFRITDTGFISLRGIPSDGDKIRDIRNILISGTFYFSIPLSVTSTIRGSSNNDIPFDITLCTQRMVKIINEGSSPNNQDKMIQGSLTDNRFFWNRSLHLPFIRSSIDTSKWLIKTMCGSIVISTVYVGAKQVKASLISRLSVERTGTRFNVRGVNDEGSVANFVETEQLINYDNYVSSYILVRGSVPLFWSQPGVNVGSHKVKMSRGSEISQPCYDKHVANLIKRYGRQHFITLCGHKEGEANLTRMYRAHHKISKLAQEIPLTIFDYHALCPKGREDNLSNKLKLEISDNLDHFGFFSALLGVTSSSSTTSTFCQVFNTQTGVFRVNCIDCLDRTNRVQTFIGLEMVESQLASIGLLEKERDKTVSKVRQGFETLWPLNGDQVSRIYSGTGALEGKSKLKDSTLSVARTIQNNLLDSSKQEAIDVLLFGKQLSGYYIEKCRNLLTVNQISHLSPGILTTMCNRYKEYTNSTTIKVVVSTYNVAGGKNFMYKTAIPLSDWLIDYKEKGIGVVRSRNGKLEKTEGIGCKRVENIMDMSLNDPLSSVEMSLNDGSIKTNEDGIPDIYAIGFEEIVDLNAGNIMAASTTNQREWLIEIQKVISSQSPYVLVTSVQLVGVCLYIFTRPHLSKYIRDVSTDTVKTGLGGAAGNKGGVGVKLTLYSTSLCFICSHFAAGQSAVQERNNDYIEISKKLSFTSLTCGETSSLNCVDYIFWCGDFNYRISLDNDTCRHLVSIHDLHSLLTHDQLIISRNEGKVFHDFIEGDINFNPTYKYDLNSDDYDTSEKQRVPAWTDRILWKRNSFPTDGSESIKSGSESMEMEEESVNGKLNFYGRSELKTSDHRPVIGEFMIQVRKVDAEKRTQVLLDCIKNHGPPDGAIVISVLEIGGQVASDPDDLTDTFVHDLMDFICTSIRTCDGNYPIVTFRKVDGTNLIRTILRSGKMALKAIELNGCVYDSKQIEISLASPDYVSITVSELDHLDNNIIPLTDSKVTELDLDRLTSESESEEVDLGPQVDPRIFCVVEGEEDTVDTGSVSGRNSPSFFDKSPSDFDRTPIGSCHTSPAHAPKNPVPSRPPSRPAPPPSRPPPVSIGGVTPPTDQPKLVPARVAPPPPVKAKIVHQQALNPPTIMKTAPSTESDKGSSFETETPPTSANPLQTKPPPIPKSPDPVKEAVSVWDSPAGGPTQGKSPPEPKKPTPPAVPAPAPPSAGAPIKVTTSKPGFKDLFAADSIDDPFSDDPFGGDPFSNDPFANDPFGGSSAANQSADQSADLSCTTADSSFNVSAPSIPPPPPPADTTSDSIAGHDTSDWTDSSCDLNESAGPPPPSAAPPPPPVPSSPAPAAVPNGPTRGPPPVVPSRAAPPSVPPRRGV